MHAIDYILLALLALLFLGAALYGASKRKCGGCSGQCGGCAMAGRCASAGMVTPPEQNLRNSNHTP